MKTTQVVISSKPGVTGIVASRLALSLKSMRSTVLLKRGEQMACARNILSVLALCATMGTTLEVQTCGDDECLAAEAVEQILTDPGDSAAR